MGDGGHPGRGERRPRCGTECRPERERRAADPGQDVGRPGRRPAPARRDPRAVRARRVPARPADQPFDPVRGDGPGGRPGRGRAVHRGDQLAGRTCRHPASGRARAPQDRRDHRAVPHDVQPCPHRRLPRRPGDGRAPGRAGPDPARRLPPRDRLPAGPGAAAPPGPADRRVRRQRPPGARAVRGRAGAGAADSGGPQRGRLRRSADRTLGGAAADDRTAAAHGDGGGGGEAGPRPRARGGAPAATRVELATSLVVRSSTGEPPAA